jgi:3-deoxy-manno-octulosonate cytidylyltransferase (CMP-KDO synthetase)
MNVADRCVIATDSLEVQEACSSVGAEVIMTSAAHPSGTDRVAEVARQDTFRGYDTIVNVQGDEPFVSTEAVRGAAGLVVSGAFEIATSAGPGGPADLDSPDVVKVVVNDSGAAMYFTRAPVPWLRSGVDSAQRAGLIWRHIGVYAYTRESLLRWVARAEHPLERVERLEQLRPLAAGERIGVSRLGGITLPGIDTEADLVFANEHWKVFTSGIQ